MIVLDEILSRSPFENTRNIRNIVVHRIKSLGNRIGGKHRIKSLEDRIGEYAETANKYVTNIRNEVEHGIDKIGEYAKKGIDKTREYLKIAKYVVPSALMTTFLSTRYGHAAYGASMLFIYHQMSQGKTNWSSKIFHIPYIVGTVAGVAGFIMGILYAEFRSLHHQYHELSTDIYNQLHNLEIKVDNLQQEVHNLENQVHNLGYKYQVLQDKVHNLEIKVDDLQQIVNNLENKLHNVDNLQHLKEDIQNIYKILTNHNEQIENLQKLYEQLLTKYNEQIKNLQKLLEQLSTNYNNLYHQHQELQKLYEQLLTNYNNLYHQYQELQQLVNNRITLENLLFGNNPYDISVIQVKSVQIENGTAYVQGITLSGSKVILEIPIDYVSNDKANIQDLFNVAQKNNWYVNIAIDRADLQYLTLLYKQNNIPVIIIQPDKPINIAVMASKEDPSTIYYVLNHLSNYNIVIQDGNPVYDSNDKLWGWHKASNSSVIIYFSNYDQLYEAKNMINIADMIIKSPNNPNPTSTGAIYTYSIFKGTMDTYNGYPKYNVGQTYISLIVLESKKGNTILNDVSS